MTTVDLPQICSLSKRRFDALAGYTRQPFILLFTEEIEWHATTDERVLGIVTQDRIDDDFGWVALGRDKQLRFRAVAVNASLPSAAAARDQLLGRMRELALGPDSEFDQSDCEGPPIDFFDPLTTIDRLHPSYRLLASQERYSPARDVIAAMMRFHEDADGNFIEQFQTTGFDPRLWELYLFATFNELGYGRDTTVATPDFILTGFLGRIAIEATTANAPAAGALLPPNPNTPEEFRAYLQDYVPIKIARALKRKLNRRPPYWETDEMRDVPFVLAVQDFHGPGTMRMVVPATTEYVFGVRHSLDDGLLKIERIVEHRFGQANEPSGFFSLPGAENISAVIVNPQGTVTKFNRMGYLAGFGSKRVRMVRTGMRRGEVDADDPMPKPFAQDVHGPGYNETWVEGMVVFHNPTARIPLDPELIPGANHEFLQQDGRIMSLLPDFHPYFSQTSITVEGDDFRHPSEEP
ncbi:hypothetical protein [Acidocella sp.]|uniref:hypothetical protein n=1 Tax=Acidocella sp. TaxID=50710 RepID=UPI00260A7773|nr:hypothetical protein [Acidocella sp.]